MLDLNKEAFLKAQQLRLQQINNIPSQNIKMNLFN